jgi:hypothetical protein
MNEVNKRLQRQPAAAAAARAQITLKQLLNNHLIW